MAEHARGDHVINGSPYDQMKGILARHLCGWITCHSFGPVDHFLEDADMILNEAHDHGIRFHLASETGSEADGFVYSRMTNGT